MRRHAPLVALTLVALGCSGKGDPATSVLPPGSTAVVVHKDGTALQVGTNLYHLAPGVRMAVGYDPGEHVAESGKKYVAPAELSGYRQVKVTIESGEHQGRSGETYRNAIGPMP